MNESELPLEIRSAAVGEYGTNAYALVCRRTLRSVLVDPGDEPDTLARLLVGTDPVAILVTHSHPDHVGALAIMRRRLGVPTLAHPGPYHESGLAVDATLRDRQRVSFGELAAETVFTPGHVPDQVSFTIVGQRRTVVGDTVFAGGPGRTATPAALRVTLDTLRDTVLRWPDDMLCLPGHGAAFTIGEIRPAVERFLARDHGDFSGDAVWEQ